MTTEEQIAALIAATGVGDARTAVRRKARELISQFQAVFGEPKMPLDLDVLTSFLGIRRSDDPPAHSPDAELVPDADGGVTMRVNADRPETRQRFSVGHEITHTFFPGYDRKVQCRPDPRHRERTGPEEFLETLCDIGASELLFPLPWFAADAGKVTTAQGLLDLAAKYRASREATARRYAEASHRCIASVFFVWKLKPTQKKTVGVPGQKTLFNLDPAELARSARELRVEYAVPSPSFADAGYFLPKDKSVDLMGPLRVAAEEARCCEGDEFLDLGPCRGSYRVLALPLFTPPEDQGPHGEVAVLTVLEPLEVKKPKKQVHDSSPTLFD